MKKLFIIGLILSISIHILGQGYNKVDNLAFSNGEKLTFRISFNSLLTGNIKAGQLTMIVNPDDVVINNRNALHVVAMGRTTGLVEFFYKIDYRFESYIDQETIVPLRFIQKKRENSYKKDETVNFNRQELIAESKNSRKKITNGTQDILSAFYYARTLNVNNLNAGNYFQIPFFLDDSVYTSKIVYAGKDRIKTKMGVFNCLKFKPMVIKGKVFDESYPITMWVTDDINRIPIYIESKLSVGIARIELTDCDGILNDTAQIVRQMEE